MSAGPTERWQAGDQVLYRYWRGSEIREVRPMTVVEDGPDWLVAWLAPGTPVIRSVLPGGRHFREAPMHQRFVLPRVAEAGTWRGTGIVKLVPAAGAFSIWLFWADGGAFLGWYGNLEDPHVRWRSGSTRIVDTADRVLDIWKPAGAPARWKDEDEFAAATGLPGYWDADQGARIRARGEELMTLARAGRSPFDHRWTSFEPDPAWPISALPKDWALPR